MDYVIKKEEAIVCGIMGCLSPAGHNSVAYIDISGQWWLSAPGCHPGGTLAIYYKDIKNIDYNSIVSAVSTWLSGIGALCCLDIDLMALTVTDLQKKETRMLFKGGIK